MSADLVRRMKAGREPVVSYKGGEATFSLRGVTASLGTIEKHLADREECCAASPDSASCTFAGCGVHRTFVPARGWALG